MINTIAQIFVLNRLTKCVDKDKDIIHTNTNYNKKGDSIKNTHVLNAKDNMIKEVRHGDTRQDTQDCHERKPQWKRKNKKQQYDKAEANGS